MPRNLVYLVSAIMALREYIFQKFSQRYLVALLVVLSLVGLAAIIKPGHAAVANNYKYVTIHYDGIEQTLATDAKTVGELLDRAHISLDQKDMVEPVKSTALLANDYNVNVYRARPVTVIDKQNRYHIVTAAQSPKQIAEAAGLKIYPEDKLRTSRVDDFVSENAIGLKVEVDRATPVNFALYGTATVARTQAKTVGDFLREKGVELKEGDSVSPEATTAITPEMTIAVTHSGTQVQTVEEDVDFPTETIRDADRDIGYKEIKQKGQKGRRIVTYEIKIENGVEVGRKELNSITKIEPKKQVEIVGTKTAGFSGDLSAALAKLRSCEGGYGSVNPAGPYYGAYQFTQGAWNAYAPAAYKGQTPTSAPPEAQDQAAANYYKKAGWRPWPACSRSLGLQDIYR